MHGKNTNTQEEKCSCSIKVKRNRAVALSTISDQRSGRRGERRPNCTGNTMPRNAVPMGEIHACPGGTAAVQTTAKCVPKDNKEEASVQTQDYEHRRRGQVESKCVSVQAYRSQRTAQKDQPARRTSNEIHCPCTSSNTRLNPVYRVFASCNSRSRVSWLCSLQTSNL